MREHYVNSLNNFISGFYMDDPSICDGVIDYFNDLLPHQKGPGMAGETIDKSRKDSTDSRFPPAGVDSRIDKLHESMFIQHSVHAYINKYNHLNDLCEFDFVYPLNLQYYAPGGGFHAWHCEKDNPPNQINGNHVITRLLTYMIYLNDVTDDGETEFLYQNFKVKPEKGLALIWPAEWTHTHRGVTSNTQEKYILTGWLNFVDHV